MKKEEFLAVTEELIKKVHRTLAVDYESFGEWCIGYFYDETDGNWKVYINDDRDGHYILLETKNEEEVYDRIIKRVNYEIECEERVEKIRDKKSSS